MDWEKNVWTGDHIMRLNHNTRIVRHRGGGLYHKEYWGDYSLEYPHLGPVVRSLQAAKRSTCKPTRNV